MAYKVYSVEALPRQGRGDAREYLMYNGFMIGPILAGQWYTLQKVYTTIVHRDFEDRLGSTKSAIDDEIAQFINANWGHRGVAVVSDEDYATSREKTEEMCRVANREHRERTVREFEHQHEAWTVGQPGRAKPSAYEEECYEVLGWPPPNSVEALRAKRMPGEAAAERMVDAFEKMMTGRAAAAAVTPKLTNEELETAQKGASSGHSSASGSRNKAS